MVLLKPDRPRRIDGVIDYFGSAVAGGAARVRASNPGSTGLLARERRRAPLALRTHRGLARVDCGTHANPPARAHRRARTSSRGAGWRRAVRYGEARPQYVERNEEC